MASWSSMAVEVTQPISCFHLNCCCTTLSATTGIFFQVNKISYLIEPLQSKSQLWANVVQKQNVLSRKICEFIWKLGRNLTFVRLGPHEQILGLIVKFTITFLSVRIGTYRKSSIKPPSQTSLPPSNNRPLFRGRKLISPPSPPLIILH